MDQMAFKMFASNDSRPLSKSAYIFPPFVQRERNFVTLRNETRNKMQASLPLKSYHFTLKVSTTYRFNIEIISKLLV